MNSQAAAPETRGFVLILGDGYLSTVQDCLDQGIRFSETIDRDIPLGRAHPSLVVSQAGTVVYAARASRGAIVATNRRRVTLDPMQPVGPLETERLLANIAGRSRRRVARVLATGGLLPPRAWADTVEAIRLLDSGTGDLLDLYGQVDAGARDAPSVIREERDASLLAMELAGIDRKVGTWPTLPGTHFLEGLSDVRLPERVALDFDQHHFADFIQFHEDVVGPALQFRDPGGRTRLTIINVDRTPVEKTVGVDLIYYRRDPEGFVLVQYKQFNEEVGGWRYRPSSDPSFDEELERMIRVRSRLPMAPTVPAPGDFRLSYDPFYFKFLAPTHGYPTEAGIIKGMYIPLGLWESLSASGGLVGPRGGTVVGWEDTERWMTTTTFVSLVAGAWVGTSGGATSLIADLIRTGLVHGRSVVVAVDEQPHHARRRPRSS